VTTKRILFLTGTRADFGKLKPLMRAVDQHPDFECQIFVTGMHMMRRYGYTVEEVRKAGFTDLHLFMNQIEGESMELVLSNTIVGLSRFVHEDPPDLLVVHGDRVEALAGAIVGSIRNILTAHVEGGEHSGTIDGLIRHSVSKMSHIHFVANESAAGLLRQLGEDPSSIHQIGSPDIDVMLSDELPSLSAAKERYDVTFDRYGIVLFHPVTSELDQTRAQARALVEGVLGAGYPCLAVYPNNDEGSEDIFREYALLESVPHICMFPSIRFEYFLTFLKGADFIVGNSSAGIREAPVYGVPTIDVGSRQRGRFRHATITGVEPDSQSISDAIQAASRRTERVPSHHFGDGRSAEHFIEALENDRLWKTTTQKQLLEFLNDE
jgi:UDP-N-acetylglucosamine 2-epimerase (hydrolysing)